MEDKFVEIKLVSDFGYTADFLRDLANYIEENGCQPKQFETFRGCAEISWPD